MALSISAFKARRAALIKRRLARLIRLRELNAPRLIVRYEQIMLAMNRHGLFDRDHHPAASNYYNELAGKYIDPLIDRCPT